MDDFFRNILAKLNSHNYKDLTLVLGNESCDLDSAVSAIVYSMFLNWQYKEISSKVCTRNKRSDDVKEDIFVPILNVDREDYDLKTEVAFLLRQNKLSESNIVFRDDHDLKELVKKGKTSVVLVDHHVLAKKDQFLAPLVTEIVDHRALDKANWNYKDDIRSTIETTGSCCTLVTQRIKDLGHLLGKDVDFFSTYPVCCKLLHATIILDTVNFSKELNKATPHDEEIILFLESLIKPQDYKTERQRVLDTLIAARRDVSTLTAAQLLKKDAKIVGNTLVPSFPLLVKDFLKKPGALQSVGDALTRQGCSMALLLGMDFSEGLQRDVAVYSPKGQQKAASFSKHLEKWSRPPLGLTPEVLPDASNLSYYWQLNLSASRKQYIPAVTAFMDMQ